jgi:hypothetical protein
MDMAISSAEIVVVVARLNAMSAMAMEGCVVTGAMELEGMDDAFIVQVQDMMIMDLVVFFVMAQEKTNVFHVMGEVIKNVMNVMEVVC